jgi:hypothetical protein
MIDILNFIGHKRERKTIETAINGNTLEHMKRKEKELGFDKRFIRPENWKKGHTFVRSGKKGSGKKELNQDMIKYIIEESREQMNFFGYQ